MRNLIQSVLLLIVVFESAAGTYEVRYFQVGGTVKLPLPASVDLKQHYVYWKLEGGPELAVQNPLGRKSTSEAEPWKNRLSWTDGNELMIKNIQQENFGTFVCEVKRMSVVIQTITYKLLRLTATVKPSTLLLPRSTLSLTCNAETLQGHENPQIHWLNPRGERERNQRSFTKIATSQDNGEWTCVATHNQIENKAYVSVTVVDLSPPTSQSQYTSKSRPLTIPCSIPAHISWGQINDTGIKEVHWHFIPKPGSSPQRLFSLSVGNPMTWKADQDRGLRLVSEPKKKDLSLTRYRGKEEDEGDYVCALEFKNGVILNRTVHVQVLRITSSPGTELISGQQLNLTCGLGQPLPSDLRLKWFPPEQSSLLSSLTSDRHPAHLTIPEVGTGDSGKWRCELWRSNAWVTFAEITLKIEPRLRVWMLVVICSVTVIVLLLLVLIFILCRRRQRKMRHLRHRLCQCKTPKPKGFYRT
ncbi:CD4-1 molecule [Epinephelus lanceolatus]|uniref:CD4-1 molecule n=1 Tax=Epinephelus lanceolatus TaxID=310571 RepID=UPI00144850C5|nr:CD4-1 molecule [Epinephelus lanceolatus]